MGAWSLRTGGRESVRSATLEALSFAADAGKVQQGAVRTGGKKARLPSLSRAGSRDLASLQRSDRLHALRLLRRFRLRDAGEIEPATEPDSGGGCYRPVRNSARELCQRDKARQSRPRNRR